MASRRPATKTKNRKPVNPKGMVNGLKTTITVVDSESVAEITKLCDEPFKIPKELDINSNRRMCTENGSGDSPISNEQPMVEEDERVRKKRKTDEGSVQSEIAASSFHNSSQKSPNKETSSTPMDRLCKQLIQALQSNDEDLLDKVLNDRTVDEITTTTTNIPGEYIQPFLEHLKRRIYTKSTENICHLSWLEKLLQTRLSLLLTLPNSRSQLNSLIEALTIRTEVLKKVITLRGMMNLIMSQVSSKPVSIPMKDRRALREYTDSSDEDSDEGEEVIYDEHEEVSNHEDDDDQSGMEENSEEEESNSDSEV